MGLSVRRSVGPSVRPSVSPSVTLSSEINVFEQISARGGVLGSLDTTLHLYPSVGLSVHRSVCRASVNIHENQHLQIKARGTPEESHVVTPSCNRCVNKRTHRWPYRSCSPPFSSLSSFPFLSPFPFSLPLLYFAPLLCSSPPFMPRSPFYAPLPPISINNCFCHLGFSVFSAFFLL